MHSAVERRVLTLLMTIMVAVLGNALAQSVTIASPGTTGALIDPQRNNTIAAYTVSNLLADPLLYYLDGEYQGRLATSWTFDEASLTYTFDLRQGVTFQNGVPLTAEAVVFSLDRILDATDPLPQAGALANIVDVRAVDDATVQIEINTVNPDFLLNLALAFIVEPGSAADGATPVGSGPFSVVEYEPDQRILLQRFDAYWDGAAQLAEIVVRNIPDPGTLVLELEAGTVDLIMFTPPQEVVRLGNSGFTPMPFGAVNSAYVALNNATLGTELRQAICLAIDRNVVLDTAYAGLGTPQYTIAKDGSWARDPSVSGYTFDPEGAAQVLDAAGIVDTNGDGWRELNGQNIVLDFQSRGDGEWLLSTQIIQQFLSDVGLNSNITTSERLVYYDAVRLGNYDLGWFISNAQPEPPIMNGIFHSTEFWNVSQAKRDDLDAAIDTGRGTADQAARAQAYFELQRLVYEDAIQCPMFWVEQAHVTSSALDGVQVSAQGVLLNGHTWSRR
ncbi:MAG: ABC transporter substrate-binding protein [Trueperaceae bacterium]|nr:ABC transporter substrate-binding protein [Trueperaceae bacterium]